MITTYPNNPETYVSENKINQKNNSSEGHTVVPLDYSGKTDGPPMATHHKPQQARQVDKPRKNQHLFIATTPTKASGKTGKQCGRVQSPDLKEQQKSRRGEGGLAYWANKSFFNRSNCLSLTACFNDLILPQI
uniref:Uncharacterized protein n=1 Tax=Arundo donax TaxID=35708 RepID=A0A0A9DTE3_ARUDO